MAEALDHLEGQGIRSVAFGDLFLADVRAYRERQMARPGMETVSHCASAALRPRAGSSWGPISGR